MARLRRVRRARRPTKSRRFKRSSRRRPSRRTYSRRKLPSVLGKRKYMGGSAPRRMGGRRVITDKGGYNQWSIYKGNKTLGRLTLPKIIRLNTLHHVWCWKAVQALNTAGNLQMNHFQGSGTVNAWPGYLVDITCIPNVVNTDGSVAQPVPVFLPTRESTGIKFSSVSGQDANGGVSTNWFQEYSAGGGLFERYVHSKSVLKWAEFRFDFWGCTSNPTKYDIMLCQFDEDVTPVPDNVVRTDPSYVQFWDEQFKPYVYNPNIKTAGFGRKSMIRVMDRRTIMIDPTSSTESDADPHCKSLRLFYNLNRQCHYDWKFSTSTVQTTAQVESNSVVTTVAENQTVVAPQARVFMYIRATKFTLDANQAAQTPVLTPTMNMQVRVCHVTGA